MLTVTQMRKAIDDLMKNIADLRSHATAENRELTVTEEELISDSLNRVEELERSLKLELRFENVAGRVDAPVNAVKPDPQANPAGTVEVRDRQQDRFFGLGEQLMAGFRATRQEGFDPRLNRDINPAFRSISGLGITTPSEGGLA